MSHLTAADFGYVSLCAVGRPALVDGAWHVSIERGGGGGGGGAARATISSCKRVRSENGERCTTVPY